MRRILVALFVLTQLSALAPPAARAQYPTRETAQWVAPGGAMDERAGDVTIDFDSLSANEVVTTQFLPDATFSSVAGQENVTLVFSGGTSSPHIICTQAVGGGLNCSNSTIVDFSDPVGELQFAGTGIDDPLNMKVAEVDVYVGGVLTSTVDILSPGNPFAPVVLDLTGFVNVTRIVIGNITDPGGIGWDDFTFTPGVIPVELESFEID